LTASPGALLTAPLLLLPNPSPEHSLEHSLLLLLSGLAGAAGTATAAGAAGCPTTVMSAGVLCTVASASLRTSLITFRGSSGQVVLAVVVVKSAVDSVSDTPFQSSPVLCCSGGVQCGAEVDGATEHLKVSCSL
jgi:hypothetical protein